MPGNVSLVNNPRLERLGTYCCHFPEAVQLLTAFLIVILIPIGKCCSHSSAEKVPFAKDSSHDREPQLAKCREQWLSGAQNPIVIKKNASL